MSNVHKSVNEMSHVYLTNERRYNYTTPKSFLEQIKLYQNLLQAKFDELQAKTVRLENGLEKLKSTSAQVSAPWFCLRQRSLFSALLASTRPAASISSCGLIFVLRPQFSTLRASTRPAASIFGPSSFSLIRVTQQRYGRSSMHCSADDASP